MNTQIQYIASQVKNIDLQFENINFQFQNNGILNMGTQINNLGIQMINLGILMIINGIQIPDLSMNLLNLKLQMETFNSQIQNLIMQINNQISNMNDPMPNMMMQFQNNPMMFFQGKKMGNIIEENPMMNITNNIKNEYGVNKYNISFKNSPGGQVLLVLDPDITVKEMLKTYLMRIKKPELFDNGDKIRFLLNSKGLKFNDNRKIKELFKTTADWSIYVWLTNNFY